VTRRRDLIPTQWTSLVAIAGTTAWGVALLSYLVNRSTDHIIRYVSLPAVVLGVLWLTLVGREAVGVPAPTRRAALAIGLGVSTLLVAVAWLSVDTRFSQSALAHTLPGGPSLSAGFDRVWDPPPLRPQAPTGEALLREHLPDESRSIVLTSADLSVEILMRAERGNRVPFGDPWEDSFVPEHHLDRLQAFVDSVEGGDRALIDGPARTAYDAYRQDPTIDPLAEGGRDAIESGQLAGLQEWVLRELSQRFDLRTVVRTDDGMEVVELVPRPAEVS
jgi:hypothetical protein